MSFPQSPSQGEASSFPICLEQAARAADAGRRAGKTPGTVLTTAVASHLAAAWRWLQQARAAGTSPRRLRVTETVSLGEKRFVSLVQVDGAQYLIGGSATSVQLLAQLKAGPDGTSETNDEARETA